MLRNELINTAVSYDGTQYDANNNIIFNTVYYGKELNKRRAYCCVFVWFCFHKIKADKMLKKTASCTDLLNWFKKNYPESVFPASEVQKDLTKFRAGDIVFYNFDADANSEHVGLLQKRISRTTIKCVEGNTSPNNKDSQDNGGVVAIKQRNVKKVLAIVHLPLTDKCPYNEPVKGSIRKGEKGNDAGWLQWMLNYNGYKCDIDLSFGGKTKQQLVNFQKDMLLNATGVLDVITMKKLKGEI